jgi:hypothetical protein
MSYFHPQRMPVLPARRRKAARRQLEQVVAESGNSDSAGSETASFVPSGSGRRIKPAVIAAGAAAIVLSTGAAAIAVAVYQPVTDRSAARCFTSADVAGFGVQVAVPGTPGTEGAVRDARRKCADFFEQGFLRPGASRLNNSPGHWAHPVPHLVVCTWHDGTAAVFPGRNGTCRELELPAAARR